MRGSAVVLTFHPHPARVLRPAFGARIFSHRHPTNSVLSKNSAASICCS